MKWLISALGAVILASNLWVAAAQQPDDPKPDAPPTAPTPESAPVPEQSERVEKGQRFSLKLGGHRRHLSGPENVQLGHDVVVKEGTEQDEAVAIFGNIQVDGTVRSDAVAIMGDAKVNGVVNGNLVTVFGSILLGTNAHVRGDAVTVFGRMTVPESATIDGERVEVAFDQIMDKVGHKFPPMVGLKTYVTEGILLARPLPHSWGWWWFAALAISVLYLFVALIFPGSIRASVETLEAQPVGSFFAGLLALVLFGPLLLLLVVTAVGILVVPFVICAAVVAFIFGKAAVLGYVGLQLGKQTGVSALQAPLTALVLGIVIFLVLYMIPIVGLAVWLMAVPLGIGAVVMALMGHMRKDRPATPAAPASIAPPPVGQAALPPLLVGESSGNLTTAEVLSLPRAGFWIRFIATFLDLFLVGAVAIFTHFPPAFLVLWLVYHLAMWAWKGTTIGGIVFGIKIYRNNGRPMDVGVALVRALASVFSALVLFLGFFWAGWSREKLAWHDKIAGTIMVRMPRGISLI